MYSFKHSYRSLVDDLSEQNPQTPDLNPLLPPLKSQLAENPKPNPLHSKRLKKKNLLSISIIFFLLQKTTSPAKCRLSIYIPMYNWEA